jgi:hypothetical protein
MFHKFGRPGEDGFDVTFPEDLISSSMVVGFRRCKWQPNTLSPKITILSVSYLSHKGQLGRRNTFV